MSAAELSGTSDERVFMSEAGKATELEHDTGSPLVFDSKNLPGDEGGYQFSGG